MNHYCVPDFEIDEDYSMPSSMRTSKKSSMAEEEDIMELLWQNGQVVAQSQRSGRKPHEAAAVIPNSQQSSSRVDTGAIRSAAAEPMTAHHHLFMQEDEMASWLHSPLDDASFDREIYADLLYPQPMSREVGASAPEIRQQLPPPPPPQQQPELVAPRPPMPPASPMFQNFMHFSRLPTAASSTAKIEAAPSSRTKVVAESNDKTVGPKYRSIVENRGCGSISTNNEAAGTPTTAKELTPACEVTVTSSPGGSGASVSASAEPPPSGEKQTPGTADDRKRKGREASDYHEGHSMDLEFESSEAKKQARGSTSTKRSRAAEVHNLSERKRRDRINEKMKALQELIPRCNKSDKASMLDEAIEYLKSLQLQVQMMSMGCSMVPMMYPGIQQYMPAMGMGMGMGMGMDMSRNHPMMSYPPLLPGSAIPNPAAAAHVGSRFPMPVFHMPPVPVPDPSRIQTSNAPDPMLNSLAANNPSQPRHPNFIDPYQQYLSFHQLQVPLSQNQAVAQPGAEQPGSSREVGDPENHQSGG